MFYDLRIILCLILYIARKVNESLKKKAKHQARWKNPIWNCSSGTSSLVCFFKTHFFNLCFSYVFNFFCVFSYTLSFCHCKKKFKRNIKKTQSQNKKILVIQQFDAWMIRIIYKNRQNTSLFLFFFWLLKIIYI